MGLDSCGCVGQPAIIASTIAAALAQGLTADEAEALGSFISTIGHALENTALQIAACEKRKALIHTTKSEPDGEKEDNS